MKTMNYALIALTFLIMSCATKHPPLKKVPSVDINRFMGKWYVISSIPTFIEKSAHNAVETYTWNEKEKRIDVYFTFNKGSFQGERKEYTQKAFVHDKSGNEWRIQFFWPLKFPYLILDLDKDYTYTVIGVPNRDYVWIMAKTPTLPEKTYQEIIERLKAQHYDTNIIEKVPQRWDSSL
jgi:apolipoprotein D and lipocalin family protein